MDWLRNYALQSVRQQESNCQPTEQYKEIDQHEVAESVIHVYQVRLKVNRADGITIQGDVLEQNHVLRDELASIPLNWRRRKIDLRRISAISRKDFAIGVVNAGMNDVGLARRAFKISCPDFTSWKVSAAVLFDAIIFAEAIRSFVFAWRNVVRS
jgi:hypothetical protein